MRAKEGKELKEKKRPGQEAYDTSRKDQSWQSKPEIFVGYQGTQTGMSALVEDVKADFHAEKKYPHYWLKAVC